MDAQMDHARQIVGQYVLTAPFSSTWGDLVETLVEPLQIKVPPSRRKQFCDEAKEEIRKAFPNSQDKTTWESRVAAWTRPKGIDKIIASIMDLARLKKLLPPIGTPRSS